MRKIVSAREIRELDCLTVKGFATPSLLLMEAAAEALSHTIIKRFEVGVENLRFQIFCATGNNGGDGAALARALLRSRVKHLDLILLGDFQNSKGDARTNFNIVKTLAETNTNLHFHDCPDLAAWRSCKRRLAMPDCIVDAMFGTGLTRPLEGIYANAVEYIDQLRAARQTKLSETAKGKSCALPLIVAVDLPSGLIADSPHTSGAFVEADLTVTFTAPKLANVLPPAARANGQLIVADVGTPQSLIDACASKVFVAEKQDAEKFLFRTRYVAGSYKNSHGHALIIAGSRDMSGASVLAADACHAAGVGLTTLATPRSAHATGAARVFPEIMVAGLPETEHGTISDAAIARALELGGRATVALLGCGITTHDETRNFVLNFINQLSLPIVLDADALNAVAPLPAKPFNQTFNRQSNAPVILTPHEGEMRRLLGINSSDKLENRVQVAREFAMSRQVILALKGERMIIAAPDGRACINPTGNPGTGTAGAGDTLAGIITACLAQELARDEHTNSDDKAKHDTAFETVIAAVYTANLAADLAAQEKGLRAMIASDIRRNLSRAFLTLDPAGERLL